MKILFALDDFPPMTYTGASIITYNLAKELLGRGHEIFIITNTRDRAREGEKVYNGMKIFRIYSKFNIHWRFWINIYNPQIIPKFRKIIKEINPDICHFHHIHQHLSYYSLKIAKKYSKAVFITAHDVMFFHYGKLMPKNGNVYYKIGILDQIKEAKKWFNPFRNLFIRHCLKCANRIFAVSNALKKVLEINGIKNIETIYNGINVSDWQSTEQEIDDFKSQYQLHGKKIALFGGRISGAKGGDIILRAIALIIKEIENIVLLVVGSDDFYIPRMVELSKKLNIDKNIKFLGWLNREKMRLINNSSDISVVPSICFDSFPTANLESMASKKPVVASCFGGSSEIVNNNETGYIVDPLNIKELNKKIIDLLKNPQKARQFGEAGHKRVKKYFSISAQADKTLKYYNKFINTSD